MKGFRVSVKFLIVATGIISTAASLGCGLLLYLEGIRLLEVTVRELSRADTDSIGGVLGSHFNQTEMLAEVLHDTTNEWGKFRDKEDFSAYLSSVSLSSTRNFNTLYGMGIFAVPLDNPREESDKYFYDIIWYDRSSDGTIDYLRGRNDPEQAWTCGKFHCVTADYIDPNNGTTLEVAYVYADGLPDLFYRTCIMNNNPSCMSNATTGLWRPPSVWFASDGAPELYLSYHRLLVVDYDNAHFLSGTMVASSTYLEMNTWQKVLLNHDTEAVVVIVGDLDQGDKSNVLAYNQNVKFSLEESKSQYPDQWKSCSRNNAATTNDCVPKLEMFPDCVAESAVLLNHSLAFRRRSTSCGDRWLRRQFFTNPKAGVDDLEAYSLLWMRDVSSIESELDRAFFIFITFLVVVFVFDVMIALSEIIFVARPLARLAESMTQLQELDLDGLDTFLTVERNNVVEEVHKLYSGMRFAVNALVEYKKFLPATFFNDSEEADTLDYPINNSHHSTELLASERVHSLSGEPGFTTIVVVEVDNVCWKSALEKKSDGPELAESTREMFTALVSDDKALRAYGGNLLPSRTREPHPAMVSSSSTRRGSVSLQEADYRLGSTMTLKFETPQMAVEYCTSLQVRMVRATWPQQLLDLETRENRTGFDTSTATWGGPRTFMYITTVSGGAVSDFDLHDVSMNCETLPDGVIVLSESCIEACGGLTGLGETSVCVPLGCAPVSEGGEEPFVLGIIAKELANRATFISDSKNQHHHEQGCSNPCYSLNGPSGKVARSGLTEKDISVAHITTSWGVGMGVASQHILDTLLVAVDSAAKRTNATLLNTYGSAVVVHWSTIQVSASVHFAGYLHEALPWSRRKRIHVGVSSGTAHVGSVGGQQRFMTAVGEPLVIAAEHSETAAEMSCLLIASRIPNNSAIKKYSRIVDTRKTPTETLFLYQVHAVACMRKMSSNSIPLKEGCYGNPAWDEAFRTRNIEAIADILDTHRNSNLRYIAKAAGLVSDKEPVKESKEAEEPEAKAISSPVLTKNKPLNEMPARTDTSDSLRFVSPPSPPLPISPITLGMDLPQSGSFAASSCCLVAIHFLDLGSMSVADSEKHAKVFTSHKKSVQKLVSAYNGKIEDFYDDRLTLIFFKDAESGLRLSLGIIEEGQASASIHIVNSSASQRTAVVLTSAIVHRTIKMAKYMRLPRLVFSDDVNDIIKTRYTSFRLSTRVIGEIKVPGERSVSVYCGIPVGHHLNGDQLEVSVEEEGDPWRQRADYTPSEEMFPETKYLMSDKQLSSVMLPWLISFGGGIILVLILFSLQTRWMGFISISTFSLITMAFSFYVVVRKRVSIEVMTTWLASAACLASYVPDYAGKGESDYWVISVLACLTCLAIHPEMVSSSIAAQLMYVFTFIYIVVEAVLSSDDIPWDYSVVNALLRLLLFAVGHRVISFLKSTVVTSRQSVQSLQQVILELAVVLRDYDVTAARQLISDSTTIEDVSKGALLGIVHALSQYRAYLPQTLSFLRASEQNEVRNPLSPICQTSGSAPTADSTDLLLVGQVRGVGTEGLTAVPTHFNNNELRNRPVTLSLFNIVGLLRVVKKANAQELQKYHEVYVVGVLDDIKKNMGVAEQLSGDRILVSYNANTRCHGHQVRAATAAHSYTRHSLAATNDLLSKLLPRLPQITTSIGIASGIALCGDMGSASMRKYTILGDVSSLVQSCERLCAAWQVSVVCDDFTKEESQYQFNYKLLDQMHYSKRTPSLVRVYQLMGMSSSEWMLSREDQSKNPWSGYNIAVNCMLNGEYGKAKEAVKAATPDESQPRYLLDALRSLDVRINELETQHGGNPPRPLPEVWGDIMHAHSLPGWIV
eukprot:TRINITY_DN20380_c0_g1_i1.p1 TRINITY_DN20380_c0_g1~~TRINITY_DN20380_c0_g1_i1.p1  ORF type:complete len:1850 (+),score=274.18 TRINITY_DN20380_c0_g1_i1:188-5737(+)